jgi:hypothetical protein
MVPAHAQDDDEEYGYEESGPGPDDEAPEPEEYEGNLAPYGNWVDDDEYGRVWHPSVSVGWSPYVDGYWTWTPYGWTWVSYEPWAWTFHYGRWALLPVGWVWVPGSVWGPAWVDWFWQDGFVGWAPLPPFATHVTVVDRFVFVRENDFCSRRLGRAILDRHVVPGHIIHRWEGRDWRHQRGPDVHRIERVSHNPVERFDHKPPGTVAPGHFGAGRQLTRPGHEPQLGRARREGSHIERGEGRPGHPSRPGGMRREAAPGEERAPRDLENRPPRPPRFERPDMGATHRGREPRDLDRPEPRGRRFFEGRESRNVDRPEPRGGRFFEGRGQPRQQAPERAPMGFVRPAPQPVPGGARSIPARPSHGGGGAEHGRGFGATLPGGGHNGHAGNGGAHHLQGSPGMIGGR